MGVARTRQVCEVEWPGASGTLSTCIDEVKKTLDDASSKHDGFINLEEFTDVIHSSSEDNLSLYDARLPKVDKQPEE